MDQESDEGHEGEHQGGERVQPERGLDDPLPRDSRDLRDRLVQAERDPRVQGLEMRRAVRERREPDVEDRGEGEQARDRDRPDADGGVDRLVRDLDVRGMAVDGVVTAGDRRHGVRLAVAVDRLVPVRLPAFRPVREEVQQAVDREAGQREERDRPDERLHRCIR